MTKLSLVKGNQLEKQDSADSVLIEAVMLCNSEWEVTVFNFNNEPSPRGQAAIMDFIYQFDSRPYDSFDDVLDQLFEQAIKYGAFFVELVLDEDGRSPIDLVLPNPRTAHFQKQGFGRQLGQMQNGKFVNLNFPTICYVPIVASSVNPYGLPLPPLPLKSKNIKRIQKKASKLLEKLFRVALQAQGIQARVVFKFAERPDLTAEIAMQEQPEHPTEGAAPGQSEPATKENGTDEALLPDIKTMKTYYPFYLPERARDILDKIPQAYEQFSRDGGRWGPGIIAPKVGINKTTVGRYLKALRRAGITEWKGIPLP